VNTDNISPRLMAWRERGQ